MKNKMNRKAQIFTLLAIFLIMLMFLSMELFSYLHKKDSINTRVSSMDSFLFSIEHNLERQIYISGFRIIFLAENEITLTGNYIDVESFFNEAFFNGTVNGVNNTILNGATYKDLIYSLNEKSRKINVDISLTDSSIQISQVDPWNIKVTLISNFSMTDRGDLARWNKQQVISAFIPVIGFEDPIYIINSNAKVSRKINKTVYEGNYVSGEDHSNLISHINNGHYTENSGAPSFLKRLEGDLSADENGIESFVIVTDFSKQGLNVYDKSIIDYIYFSGRNPPYYTFSGMPGWFKIDNEDNHLEKYQLS